MTRQEHLIALHLTWISFSAFTKTTGKLDAILFLLLPLLCSSKRGIVRLHLEMILFLFRSRFVAFSESAVTFKDGTTVADQRLPAWLAWVADESGL